MAALFRIEPVEVARRQADSASFLLHTDAGRPLTLVYRFWLVHGPDGITVVDTGLTTEEAARRGIAVEHGLKEALAPHGIGPDEVDTLILTHLHWDHACAVDALPNATVWLQRAEADFFNHPLRAHPAIDRYFGRHDVIRELLGAPRLKLVEGEAELPNGLRLVPLGGHTPGLQGVALPTEEGLAVITSDAVPFNRNYTDDLPNGILQDLGQAITSLKRLRALCPDVIYTGHDPIPRLRTGAPH
ncbi:N-acyl homoserine lactonase family protein [Xanthobacter sp. KR7-225]|uniref:N-acyl homoserine lactonase family protein n=1 Tax=Xanthobacter sp. KR7-225 TaxID=3156613 RepID=UPI0032B31EAF